ncbi:MAG: bifunctional folylpolyglutamate synthase/dihydrofolate synthase [Planctomycetota bacterium]|nr:MAG: bifunctional folylpolyglutamate synthase/dihydrofolate synthase [Planctomycetota bacterium]
MSRVGHVTPEPSPLDAFHGLLDRERSRAFHRGELAFSLDVPRALLAALPAVRDPRVSVQIVGSEGKTSTAWLLSAALAAQGLRVGTFTSPHVHDARERLRVDLELPEHAALARAVKQVIAACATLSQSPSWFEVLAATARQLFAEQALGAQVWEAGLGGRLDVTTLMPAQLVILSSVSLEHTAILGDTLELIAGEKLAALRPGGALLLPHELPGSVRELAEQAVRAQGAQLFHAPAARFEEPSARARALARGACEALRALQLLPDESALRDPAARHAAARAPAVPSEAECRALATARVPGRDARVHDLFVDAAHSAAACRELAARVDPNEIGWLVFGATAGRDAAPMLAPLVARVPGVLLTRVPGGREQSPQELAACLPSGTPHEIVDDPRAALQRARELSPRGRRILVTGSLYLLAALLPPGPDRS